MVKGVIFDMDGVLVDNRDVHIEAFEILFKKYGVPFSLEKFMPLFGRTNDSIFDVMSPELKAKYGADALGSEKEAIYRDLFAKKMAPVKGLPEFLAALKDAGVKISVGSSGGTDNVNYVLKGCGIAKYFDAIANGDMISRGKPDPEVYLLAAKLLGLEPSECVVCEDAPVGIEAARAAGMAVVALTTTFPAEQHKDYDIMISDFTQIALDDVLNIDRK